MKSQLAQYPRKKGAITPITATSMEEPPTFIIPLMVDSSPTSKSKIITPMRARLSTAIAQYVSTGVMRRGSKKLQAGFTSTRFPRIIPPMSSPSTAGMPKRSTTAPPNLAAAKIAIKMISTCAIGSLWPEDSAANEVFPANRKTRISSNNLFFIVLK